MSNPNPNRKPNLHLRPALPSEIPALSAVREAAFSSGPISRGMFRAGRIDSQTLAVRNAEMAAEMGDGKNRFVVACLAGGDEGEGGDGVGVSAGAGVGTGKGVGKDEELPVVEGGEGLVREKQQQQQQQQRIEDDGKGTGVEGSSTPSFPLPGNAPGTAVAYIKWVECLEERPASEWDVPLVFSADTLGPAYNLELFEDFIAGMQERTRGVVQGRPHILLSMLVTAPNHQGIGAGGALIEKCLERLDSLNAARSASSPPLPPMDCYVEASPPGYAVYYRHGFRDVAVHDIDLAGKHKVKKTAREEDNPSIWGTGRAEEVGGKLKDGWFRTVVMVRKGKVNN